MRRVYNRIFINTNQSFNRNSLNESENNNLFSASCYTFWLYAVVLHNMLQQAKFFLPYSLFTTVYFFLFFYNIFVFRFYFFVNFSGRERFSWNKNVKRGFSTHTIINLSQFISIKDFFIYLFLLQFYFCMLDLLRLFIIYPGFFFFFSALLLLCKVSFLSYWSKNNFFLPFFRCMTKIKKKKKRKGNNTNTQKRDSFI